MEKFTQKWAIISLLEDVDEGTEFDFTNFPLHVTLAGVFAINRGGQELVDGLAKILAGRPNVEIVAEEKDMFGPNKDITVMKIKKTSDLMNLYSVIYEWLENAGAMYNAPEYQGENYIPHSTFQKTGSLRQDEKRILKSVSLIDLFPHNDGFQRKIFKTVDLL